MKEGANPHTFVCQENLWSWKGSSLLVLLRSQGEGSWFIPVKWRVGSLSPAWRCKNFTTLYTFPCIEADGMGENPKMCHYWKEASLSPGLLALKDPIKPTFSVLLSRLPLPHPKPSFPWGLGWLQVKVALETQFWHPFLQEVFPSASTPNLHPSGAPAT